MGNGGFYSAHAVDVKLEEKLPSKPPSGKCKVTNIYVDPDTGKMVVCYDIGRWINVAVFLTSNQNRLIAIGAI